MLRSLRARLILAFLLVVAVAIGIAAVVAERTTTREFSSYQRSSDTAYVESLAQKLGDYYQTTGSWENVQPVLASLPVTPGRLQLQDASGTIIAESTPGRGPGGPAPRSGLSGAGGSQSRGQMGGQGAGDPMSGAEEPASGDTAQGQVNRSVPVYANGQQVATLLVLSGGGATSAAAETGDRFIDRVRTSLVVGGIAALAAALVLAALVAASVTGTLRRLRDAARRIAAGDFSQRVKITSPAEVAELGNSFNQMAEALEDGQRARRQLLADIVHELRTPLSIIQGTAQGFLDGVIAPDAEHSSVIRNEAALLSKLITDLRDLSLAEAGELQLEKTPSDLGDLARQAVAAIQFRAQEQGIELKVLVSPNLPPCLVDRDRMLQILGNLLDNALRHTPQGGRGTVRVYEPAGGSLAVEVADTGEGIPPEHLPHIFERFYRVDASRARGGGRHRPWPGHCEPASASPGRNRRC
jgi:signal transduction histidine kinase